jgi:uncharacterized protein (TIGR02246 family)
MLTTTIDNKQVMTGYVAALAAGDAEAVRGFFAEDATWWLVGDLPISGTWHGRDAIMEDFFGMAMARYEPDSIDLEVTAMVAEGDQVTLEWTSRARTTAGEPYENFCIGVFTLRDGRIAGVREYMDTAYARRVVFGADR